MMATALRAARANLLLAPTGTVIAFLAAVLVARWLGPATYADYATLMALATWLVVLGEGGFNVGLGRFLHEAGSLNARASLYRALQYRRWAITFLLACLLIWLGPVWVRSVGFTEDRWPPINFLMVGLLAGAMLHGQLASSVMFATFRHGRVVLTNQSMTIARALVLAGLAGTLREPIMLIVALFVLAAIEAGILHYATQAQITHERATLPTAMVNAVQKHGFVSLFDKVTTALSAGPFLLLVLAGVHAREDLAMLAVATDLLQKALSVIGLPLSNIAMPMLNDSRRDLERFRRQVARLGGLMVVLFAVAVGAILTVLPVGLPLLLGEAYGPAVAIAATWLLPTFFESGVRMIWGSALVALDQYKWLVRFNLIYGLLSLLVVLAARDADLNVLLVSLGVVRFFMGAILLRRAAKLALLPPESRPLRIVAVAGVACAVSLALQSSMSSLPAAALAAGVVAYLAIVCGSLRWLSLVPVPAYDALCKVAGKHRALLTGIIRSPLPERRRV